MSDERDDLVARLNRQLKAIQDAGSPTRPPPSRPVLDGPVEAVDVPVKKVSVTTKGQITFPAPLAKRWGVVASDPSLKWIEWVDLGYAVVILPNGAIGEATATFDLPANLLKLHEQKRRNGPPGSARASGDGV